MVEPSVEADFRTNWLVQHQAETTKKFINTVRNNFFITIRLKFKDKYSVYFAGSKQNIIHLLDISTISLYSPASRFLRCFTA